MIRAKAWLFDFDENFRESINLGDNSIMKVMGKGNVKSSIGNEAHMIVDVYFIPDLKNNLLSIG